MRPNVQRIPKTCRSSWRSFMHLRLPLPRYEFAPNLGTPEAYCIRTNGRRNSGHVDVGVKAGTRYCTWSARKLTHTRDQRVPCVVRRKITNRNIKTDLMGSVQTMYTSIPYELQTIHWIPIWITTIINRSFDSRRSKYYIRMHARIG